MADKKKAAEGGSVSGTKAAEKVTAEKAVVPEVAGAAVPRAKSTKIPKFAKKNKSRLPRREKKAQQKAADAQKSGS